MSPFINRMKSPSPDPSTSKQPPTTHPKHIQWTPPKKKSGSSQWKGKDRALLCSTSDVGSNLLPGMGEITYRHLSSGQPNTPTNPLRVIAHVDIDAAYAAMEMARLKIDPTIPLAVQQWQGLIAVNYPARKYGITRHETPAEALKKCPNLVMVHCATYKEGDEEPSYDNPNPTPATHKISLDHYRRESLKIIKVFTSHIPTVEKASIDESYLDASPQVREILLTRYPELANVPKGRTIDDPVPSPRQMGIKTVEWRGNLIPVDGQKKEDIKRSPLKSSDHSLGEVDQDVGESQKEYRIGLDGFAEEVEVEEEDELTWSDVALSIGAELVEKCRIDVHQKLGYTCSAGIAPNKMLAKLCSAWKKPNAQTILRCSAVAAFLRPLPFQKIRNLGGKLGNSVKEVYEASTVNDLLEYPLNDMQRKLGDESGLWLWEIVRGLDFGEVEPKTHVKSMLSSKNFRPSISKFKEVVHWMNILATELHLRLVEARQLDPSLWPRTIHFTHRSPSYVIRGHQAPFPYTSQLSISYIAKQADRLLRSAIPDRLEALNENSFVGPWSNLQLSFGGLGKKEEGVGGIEKFLTGNQPAGAEVKKVEKRSAVDEGERTKKIRKKEVVQPKKDLGTIELSDSSDEDIVLETGEEEVGSRTTSVDIGSNYTCGKCKKRLEADDEQTLEKVKAEHEDYHFAREMMEKDRLQRREPIVASSSKMKKQGSGSKVVPKVEKEKDKVEKEEIKEKGQKSLRGFFGA